MLQPCHRSCQVSNCLSRIQWTLSRQNCKAAKTDETQFNNCIALWRLGARSHYFLSCSSTIKRTTPSVVSCRCKLLNAPKNNNNYLNKPDLQATAANSIHNRCIVDYFVGYILLTCSQYKVRVSCSSENKNMKCNVIASQTVLVKSFAWFDLFQRPIHYPVCNVRHRQYTTTNSQFGTLMT